MRPVQPDTVGAGDVVHPSRDAEDPHTRHDRERRESLREERRLLVWQVLCILLVVLFVVVRQLWLT
jgi:hypothetical protein